ncbi:MAG: hypothetical protein J6D46_08670, partial [Lachnospiraceae bacterium]|nr:hypothetical protein [Lachnospiraceae bacterium]
DYEDDEYDEEDEERESTFSAVKGWFGRLRERFASDRDEDDDEYDEDEDEEDGEDDEYADHTESGDDEEKWDSDEDDTYDEADEYEDDEYEDDEYDDSDEPGERGSVFGRLFSGRFGRRKSGAEGKGSPDEYEEEQNFDEMEDEDVYFADLHEDERARRSQRTRTGGGRKARADISREDSYYSDIRTSSRYSESQYNDDLSMEEIPDNMTIRGEDFTQMLRKAVRDVRKGGEAASANIGGRTRSSGDAAIELDDGEIIPGSAYDASRGMTITGFDEDSENG